MENMATGWGRGLEGWGRGRGVGRGLEEWEGD